MNKFISVVILLSFYHSGCVRDVPPNEEVLAQVNNAYLLRGDVSDIQKDRIPGYVTRWIDQELLYQAAVKHNIHKDAVVRKQVEDYRREVLGKLFVETYYSHLPEIGESDLRSFYSEHLGEFTRNSEEAKIYHFIFTSRTDANAAARILKYNSSGDERRNLFSSSRVENIVVKKGFLAEELNNALFNSRSQNRTIGPVRIGDVYHVLEVQERYAKNSQVGFDEAYDEIYQRMLHGLIMRIEAGILDSLRDDALIRINQENH